jgi:2-oxoisovalerate dehydrogenase E1 component
MRANLPAYRTDDEAEAWRAADPVVRLKDRMAGAGEIDAAAYEVLTAEVEAEIEAAIAQAKSFGEPTLEDALSLVAAPAIRAGAEPPEGTRRLTYQGAINEAFHQEMARDPDVILIGEDVARIGGIFGMTRGLMDAFGPERVRDTPISEGVIASCGVGAALRGKRVIVEAQLWDFVTLMMDAIVNQAAKARFMLGGGRRSRSCSGGRRGRASGSPRSIPSRSKASSRTSRGFRSTRPPRPTTPRG